MVDETQNANLQQSGDGATTGNPQQVPAQTGLQPQNQTNLQQTTAQTVNSLNQLDQGSVAIPLSGIANTTTTTVQVAQTKPSSNGKILAYGGVGIIVAAIMAAMVYSLLRQS